MLQNILLCTDGSDQAMAAARTTADLARRHKARVALVNVLDPIIAAGPAGFVPEACVSAEITLEFAEDGQRSVLKSTGDILAQAGVAYRAYAEMGHPVERIREIAQQEKSDLIVIGSRGLSTWPALLLGSVSEGVAQHASRPVLIVRGELKGLHRIVMASDGSEGANRAVRFGMELAKTYQADVGALNVVVLNVFQPHIRYANVARDDNDPQAYAALVREAITRQVEPAAQAAGIPYQLRQEQGHPAETLVGFAGRQLADLIVVGNRGLGGFQSLMLGSVSRSVLHQAHCSILVVP